MKELVSKLHFYLYLFYKKLVFSWQTETAYTGNILGDLASTFFYNIAYVIFLDVVIKEVKSFAGYSFEEMLVFTLISQMVLYSESFITLDSVRAFVDGVRSGNFDVLILKPLSLFFQVMTLEPKPFKTVFLSIPSFLIYFYLILKYNAFHPTAYGVGVGLVAMVIGSLFLHFYRFAIGMTIFKFKQNKKLLRTSDISNQLGHFPYEAYSQPIHFIISTVAPLFLAGSVPALYFLNRTTSLRPFAYLLLSTLVVFLLTVFLWKRGLRKYESASS